MTSQFLLSTFLGIVNPVDTCPRTINNFYQSNINNLCATYDFIVVGGGTSGCVIANRLTKDPSVKVLLIEDGGYPSRESEIPLDFLFLQLTEEDWQFNAVQDNFFKGTTNLMCHWPQGRVLGGGSTINALIYASGYPYDYDKWATLTQDPLWSWSSMQAMFDRVDQIVETTQPTSYIKSRQMLGLGISELGYSVNGPEMFGYKDHKTTIYNHTRNSMAKAYIKPVISRPNLFVLVNTRVNKIIIDDFTDPNNKIATGVEIQFKQNKTTRIIKASKEVIITAGAINSPKLLMLSGIGQSQDLLKLGLNKTYSDLPVGQNLEDHVIVPVFVKILNEPMPAYKTLKDVYCKSGSILDNNELANFLGFINTKNDTTHPDIEFLHLEFLAEDPTFLEAYIDKFGIAKEYADQLREANKYHGLLLCYPVLLHPLSRGAMYLKDLNLETPPNIIPNYFAEEDDNQVVVNAINEIIIKLLKTIAFIDSELFKFDIPECDNAFEYLSYEYWKCYFRYFAGTLYHPAGTCRMGFDRNNSVVDSRLRVWGIKNLRVCDSSTIPALISGHTNIPTAALAENAAEIIIIDNNIIYK